MHPHVFLWIPLDFLPDPPHFISDRLPSIVASSTLDLNCVALVMPCLFCGFDTEL